jgi:hypothetical protein
MHVRIKFYINFFMYEFRAKVYYKKLKNKFFCIFIFRTLLLVLS